MSRARACRGSILIVTLWLIALLSVLAVAIGRYLSLEVRLAHYRAARLRAGALARSGVYLAMQRLARDLAEPEAGGKPYDWLYDDWAAVPDAAPGADPEAWTVAATDGTITVRIRDAERALDLNAADADQLREQLARLTGDEAAAQAIIDARDAADAAEDAPASAPPYFAKNGPFAAPEELADLPGMSRELYARLAEQTTPYRAGEPVNLNTATTEVLRAAGLTESTVQLLLRFREGLDGPAAHGQDGIFEEAGVAVLETLRNRAGVDLAGAPDGNLLVSNFFGVTSTTFTVTAEAAVADPPVAARVQAVVRRAACSEGVAAPCILAWREG